MSESPAFTIEVDQNEYLAEGEGEVHAVVTVTATGEALAVTAPPRAVEVIIVDCSGSMDYPRTKIAAARQATCAAITALRDGTHFAVIAGNDKARVLYPPQGGTVAADATTRAAAIAETDRLRAGGGTAIGRWLLKANELFAGEDDALRHAILLTDGKDEHETPQQLEEALATCADRFVCDCRGVGTKWKVEELTKVARALLGSVDIVADPAGLEADFRGMTQQAMGKRVADVALRLWTPQGAEIAFVKQVSPDVVDLTARRVESGPRSGDYPTGAWGAESRDYHVCVRVTPGGVGDEMLAGRVSLVAKGSDGTSQTLGQGRVRAIWTDDTALSTRISPGVAHYSGQAELAQAIQQGLEARRAGDEDVATAKLGRAVALAHQSGNESTAKLLAKVVEVENAETGTVRLRHDVQTVDEMTLDVQSTKTVRTKKFR
jgi:hypothetical protein